MTISEFPRLVKGALVTLDTSLKNVTNTIVFQYNPDTLTRSLQVQSIGGESGARAEPLRLQGPPIETIQLEAEFDTTGPLFPNTENATAEFGIYPQLSALETLIYPTTNWVKENFRLAEQGTVEIVPPEAPMILFVWGKQRVVPVRLADFSITEEAYDVNLNPVRAKVSLSLRVLNYNDLPNNQGKLLFFPHHRKKENLAQSALRGRNLSSLNIRGVAGNSLSSLL